MGEPLISAVGQSRPFCDVGSMSGLPPESDRRGDIPDRELRATSGSRYSPALSALAKRQGRGPTVSNPPPPHMVWMTEATRDDTLADVLTFLRGEPGWFDLYKAFELMRDDINSKLGQNKYEQMGWPDKKTVDVFSESAQVYRHSRAKWPEGYDLITAMKSDEAREFIQSLALAWLGWHYPDKT